MINSVSNRFYLPFMAALIYCKTWRYEKCNYFRLMYVYFEWSNPFCSFVRTSRDTHPSSHRIIQIVEIKLAEWKYQLATQFLFLYYTCWLFTMKWGKYAYNQASRGNIGRNRPSSWLTDELDVNAECQMKLNQCNDVEAGRTEIDFRQNRCTDSKTWSKSISPVLSSYSNY